MPTVPLPVPEKSPPLATPDASKPRPPLVRANTPETSEEPRAIAPLNRAPAAVLLTGRAEEREEIVVEPITTKGTLGVVVPIPKLPLCVNLKSEAPDVEEISNGSIEAAPVTARRVKGVVVPIPTLPEEFTLILSVLLVAIERKSPLCVY